MLFQPVLAVDPVTAGWIYSTMRTETRVLTRPECTILSNGAWVKSMHRLLDEGCLSYQLYSNDICSYIPDYLTSSQRLILEVMRTHEVIPDALPEPMPTHSDVTEHFSTGCSNHWQPLNGAPHTLPLVSAHQNFSTLFCSLALVGYL